MNAATATWVLLLASGAGTAAADPAFDCVSGLCLGESFAVASTGPDWVFEDWPEPERCTQVSGGTLPPGVGMMVQDGRIARFEIGLSGAESPGNPAPAPFGLQRGMSLGEAGARFPSEQVQLDFHKYAWPPGIYLTWRDAARDRGVRAELPEAVVEVILWGTADAVMLTEGCA